MKNISNTKNINVCLADNRITSEGYVKLFECLMNFKQVNHLAIYIDNNGQMNKTAFE
jgi:hypothetical protein